MAAEKRGSGIVALFGSGETGKHGRLIQEQILAAYPTPVRVAIVETPAGFQPNIDRVTGKLSAFYQHNLQNTKPIVTVVDARRRGGPHDPDDPAVAAKLANAELVFAGPGSPTYMVRHLEGTRTLDALRSAWSSGAALVLASAATVAAGALAIPVYEVFKVGDDPVWMPGLDLLADVAPRVVVVPHWNNNEGGAELDTSHCFIGAERFAALTAQLPAGHAILGIDEHTAVLLDPVTRQATVRGAGTTTILHGGDQWTVPAGESFALSRLTPGAELRP